MPRKGQDRSGGRGRGRVRSAPWFHAEAQRAARDAEAGFGMRHAPAQPSSPSTTPHDFFGVRRRVRCAGLCVSAGRGASGPSHCNALRLCVKRDLREGCPEAGLRVLRLFSASPRETPIPLCNRNGPGTQEHPEVANQFIASPQLRSPPCARCRGCGVGPRRDTGLGSGMRRGS